MYDHLFEKELDLKFLLEFPTTRKRGTTNSESATWNFEKIVCNCNPSQIFTIRV